MASVKTTMSGRRKNLLLSYRSGSHCMVMHTVILLCAALVFSATGAAAVRLDGPPMTAATAQEILRRLHYTLSNQNPSSGEEQLTVINLDLLPDDVIATDVEDGVQDEFDNVDRVLGDDLDSQTNSTLPEHRINRQMSLIYQGVYVPDARFNPFVDGVMTNMITEIKRKQMDPLYFRVHKGGGVKHVPTRQKQGTPKSTEGRVSGRSSAHSRPELPKEKNFKQEPIGGGVIRGLTRIKRFGNAEVQTVGNATLVRSHYVLGPLDVEFVFETTNGVRLINSTLTALPGHGLARVNATSAEFLDFIIDRFDALT
ncbi:hypothetical protein FHG87_022146 [Trinorchestia longiramus]|nr:hypothetical protein FHG87_022146 [Trinorchestia longiramus]